MIFYPDIWTIFSSALTHVEAATVRRQTAWGELARAGEPLVVARSGAAPAGSHSSQDRRSGASADLSLFLAPLSATDFCI